MLEIYMVRHGQTLFNQKDLVQGWCDSPLSENGLSQAKALAKNMQMIDFTLAYSSPSERAMDTCETIIDGRIPIHRDKRLKEMNFGYLEGDKNATLRIGKPDDFEELLKVGWVDEGGENEAMVLCRIASFFEELTSQYHQETILLTSHGMWIDRALKYMMKEQYSFYRIENCSVSKVIFDDGKYLVQAIGDTSYRDKGVEL